MQGELIMFVGLPGSGKSTYFQKYFSSKRYIRLSLDDFRKLITGHDYHEPFEPVAHAWIEQTGRYFLSQGYRVILDNTHLRRGLRTKWCRIARQYDAKVSACYFKTSLETCLERNAQRERKVPEEVLKRMHEQFEEILPEEDFDEIVVI